MFITTFILIRLLDAAGSGAGGAGGSGAASTPAAAAVNTPAAASTPASTPGGQQGTPPTPDPAASANQPDPSDPAYGNWKALRDTLTNERTRAAGLETQLQPFTALRTSSLTVAKALGYDEADFTSAFNSDPVGTITVLRQEEAQRRQQGGRQDQGQGEKTIQEQVAEAVAKATAPVNETVNRQVTEVTFQKYNVELASAIKADPILQNAPEEVHGIVKDYLEEYFASQPQVLLAMKQKGDFSAVPEAVNYISGRLNTAFSKWLAHNNAGGRPVTSSAAPLAGPNGKKFTLDDIIDDPAVLGGQYK